MVEIFTVKSDTIKYNWTLNSEWYSGQSRIDLELRKEKNTAESTINSHIFKNLGSAHYNFQAKLLSQIHLDYKCNLLFHKSLQYLRTLSSYLCSLDNSCPTQVQYAQRGFPGYISFPLVVNSTHPSKAPCIWEYDVM